MSQNLTDRPLWEQISVQQFLGSVNWDGLAQKPNAHISTALHFDVNPDFQRPDPNAPLSLTLTVEQFMTAVNWDGVAMMEVPNLQFPPAPDAAKSRESSFTLNDFSDLF